MTVDEKNGLILSAKCHDCAASEGGCKHAVAFLMWVHRRSEEPACTSVECYWRKAKLSKIGTSLKFILAREMTRKKLPSQNKKTNKDLGTAVFNDFINEARKRSIDCQLLKHQPDYDVTDVKMLSMQSFVFKIQQELC